MVTAGELCNGLPNDHVQELSRSFVLPAKPTKRHNFFLSCLDCFWRDIHYNRRLIFYESSSDFVAGAAADHHEGIEGVGEAQRLEVSIVEKLKSSLALCLVHYYPWCGRIAEDEASSAEGRLVIDCNDAGVEFVVARTDMNISQISTQGYQMKPFFDKLCQHVEHTGDCLYSSPLLSIQVTLFSDGGLAIGITQSHIVADGQSLWNFMVSWGECSRGVPLTLPPSHNRDRLALQNPSPEKARLNFNSAINKEDLIVEEEAEVSAEAQSDNNLSANGHVEGDATPDPLVQCLFELSSTSIKKLKRDAGGTYSSYEVTCAHFWKRVTVARKSPSREQAYFATLANCRNRIRPPLPPAYFGNVIMFGISFGTVGKLCQETLGVTASCIHDAVLGVTEDTLFGFMHWLETHNNSLRSAISSPPEGKGMNVASSPRFPVYEVDFGWGKPAAVRCAKVEGDGEMVLFGGRPGSGPGDMEICMALPATVLRRLLQDPQFLAKSPCSPFDREDMNNIGTN